MNAADRISGVASQDGFLLKIPPGARVLELGCGSGTKLQRVHELNPSAELWGCDIVPVTSLPDSARFAVVNLEHDKLPYADGYFDVIIMIHVLEHLAHHALVAEEARRVLRPGGLVYIEAPNFRSTLLPSFLFHVEQGNPVNFYDDPSHVRPWTKGGLFFYLRGHDFLVQSVGLTRPLRLLPLATYRLLRALLRGDRQAATNALWTVVGWSVYAIGRKPASQSESWKSR